MTVNILLEESPPGELNLELLKKAIHLTLTRHNYGDADVTLLLTNDEEMEQLNKDYRGISSTTDVLSFNQGYIDPDTRRLYFGDIVISVQQASKQAKEAQHSLIDECILLTIHGTLHLLGYDHINAEDKQIMWEEQTFLLEKILSDTSEEQE